MFRARSYLPVLIVTAVFSMIVFSLSALAGEKESKTKEKKEVTGQQYYQQYCASCHALGGNLAKPKKPIAGSSELKSIATFQKYLEDPPGHMPYFKSVAGNKKTLQKLYEYCRKLKKTESA